MDSLKIGQQGTYQLIDHWITRMENHEQHRTPQCTDMHTFMDINNG